MVLLLKVYVINFGKIEMKKDNITPNKIQDIKGNNNIIINDSEK